MGPTILHLEDSELDAELIQARLRRSGFDGLLVRAVDRTAYVEAVCDGMPIDLILSDYHIPGFDGLEALEMARQQRPDVPFVFVSGAIGEDVAVEMLKRGATDYVLKQRLDRLGAAVERALAEANERTERRRAEGALRESEERLRLALTAVRMVAWELVPSPRQVIYTGDLQDVFGLPCGRRPDTHRERAALIHPEDFGTYAAIVERAIAEGGDYTHEYRIVRPDDGAVQWMEERAHAVRDVHGRTVRLLGVVVDVTDRKRAEEEVRRLNDQLEEKVVERTGEPLAANEQLQGFTYSIAHDLRQQIRGISTNAHVVLEGAPDALDEMHRKSLQRLVGSARQLSTLVDDLLRYARLGQQEAVRDRVDLSEIAWSIGAELASEEYGYKTMDFEVEPGLVAEADASMVVLAMQNLIDNAFKYSSRCEVPCVRVGRDERGFFVRDNGIGFDMAFAHKVFEPFERLHGGTAYAGTGIGLANVKRIVEKHGGRIWVESEPEKGTTFGFTLHRAG